MLQFTFKKHEHTCIIDAYISHEYSGNIQRLRDTEMFTYISNLLALIYIIH